MFHITSLFPNKSLRQDRLGICVLNTSVTVSCFFLTILYSCGNWSRRDLFPSHMSSQNLTCDPSFIIKVNERLAKSARLRAAELLEREIYSQHLTTCNDAVHSQRVSADKLVEHIVEVKDLVEQAAEKRRDQEGAVVSDIATILAYLSRICRPRSCRRWSRLGHVMLAPTCSGR